MNLFLADGVGNLRDPRVGNIMTLDTLGYEKRGGPIAEPVETELPKLKGE
jgi:hypothetical protein